MGMTYSELKTLVEIEPLSGQKNEYLGTQVPCPGFFDPQ